MPASDSGPPLQLESLTSDSNQRLQPGMHRTSAYSSSLDVAIGADWDQPTGDAHSVRTQKTGGTSKAERSSQSQYQGLYPVHL